MKILLDESLPRKIKYDFGTDHEVWTVKEKGWLGQKNGALLKLMTDNGFELFITVDQNLAYQQNVDRIPLRICVFCGADNRRETLAKLIPVLFLKLAESNFPNVIEIS